MSFEERLKDTWLSECMRDEIYGAGRGTYQFYSNGCQDIISMINKQDPEFFKNSPNALRIIKYGQKKE